jgi:hypothetical protein
MSEEEWNWPEGVTERLQAYADRTDKSIEEAVVEFTAWLQKEFNVTDTREEDEYLLVEWSEMFVIETRNLGGASSGGRETTEFVGHIVGLDEYVNDLRKNMYETATGLWRQNSDRAIDEKYIGVVSARNGVWHVNGEPSKERVDGDELPWFGFEFDNHVLCLLNRNTASNNVGKPMAPSSMMRTLYFLGNEEALYESSIKLWRVGLTGKDMEAEYQIGEPCRIKVVGLKEGTANAYTNRGFQNSIVYTDNFVAEEMRRDLVADRFLVHDQAHNLYVELDELTEAYEERKEANPKTGGFYGPTIITKGFVSRMNIEPNESDYDQTGRSFRLCITSHALQVRYGRDSPLSEVTVWVPGRTYDDCHPFEFKNSDGEWVPYAERTQVILCCKLKMREFNDNNIPSLTAYGVYVPPRTARPAAIGGDTSLSQFGSDE